MPATQSAQSHAALDPLTHFILGPIFTINFGLAINYAARAWPLDKGFHLWLIVLAAALLLLNIKTRVYSLKVQDRLIRLEERLRLQSILPASQATAATALTTRQLIALRFASDAELPTLVRRTLAENLDGKQIKAAITTWRPDLARI